MVYLVADRYDIGGRGGSVANTKQHNKPNSDYGYSHSSASSGTYTGTAPPTAYNPGGQHSGYNSGPPSHSSYSSPPPASSMDKARDMEVRDMEAMDSHNTNNTTSTVETLSINSKGTDLRPALEVNLATEVVRPATAKARQGDRQEGHQEDTDSRVRLHSAYRYMTKLIERSGLRRSSGIRRSEWPLWRASKL